MRICNMAYWPFLFFKIIEWIITYLSIIQNNLRRVEKQVKEKKAHENVLISRIGKRSDRREWVGTGREREGKRERNKEREKLFYTRYITRYITDLKQPRLPVSLLPDFFGSSIHYNMVTRLLLTHLTGNNLIIIQHFLCYYRGLKHNFNTLFTHAIKFLSQLFLLNIMLTFFFILNQTLI